MTRDEIDRLLITAGRALARHGLVHAYGHCSVRIDAGHFRVSAAKPLGMTNDDDPGIDVPIEGPLPEGVLGEVRAHREIYRLRRDVKAIVRCMPPKVMSLAAMHLVPKPRHGFGSYFFPAPAFWHDAQLLRNDDQARRFAETLGLQRAIIMRANGAVIVGDSLQEAAVLSWYLEDAARVELDCLAAGRGDAPLLTAEEAAERATWSGRILDRMWSYLTAGSEPG